MINIRIGFLYALGLSGHIKALNVTDQYSYLTQGHALTTISMLLGVASAYRGTMHPLSHKLLCLHIPSLLPTQLSQMEMFASGEKCDVQTAAMLGIGLLYCESGQRLMSEFLLTEMGVTTPVDDREVGREGFLLASGFALGLVNLARGTQDEGHVDEGNVLQDRLLYYINGGTQKHENINADSVIIPNPKPSMDLRNNKYSKPSLEHPVGTSLPHLIYTSKASAHVKQTNHHPSSHFLSDCTKGTKKNEKIAGIEMFIDNMSFRKEMRTCPSLPHRSLDYAKDGLGFPIPTRSSSQEMGVIASNTKLGNFGDLDILCGGVEGGATSASSKLAERYEYEDEKSAKEEDEHGRDVVEREQRFYGALWDNGMGGIAGGNGQVASSKGAGVGMSTSKNMFFVPPGVVDQKKINTILKQRSMFIFILYFI